MDSKAREILIAGRLGMQRVPQSGSDWMLGKEDLISTYFLAQIKSTFGESNRVAYQDVLDLFQHARVAHRAGLFILDFADPDEQLVAVPWQRLDDFVQKWQLHREEQALLAELTQERG